MTNEPIKVNMSSEDLMKQTFTPTPTNIPKVNISSQELMNPQPALDSSTFINADSQVQSKQGLEMSEMLGGGPIGTVYDIAKERYPSLVTAYNIAMGGFASGINRLFVAPIIKRNAQSVIENPNSTRQEVADATARLQKANDFNKNMFNFISANTPLGETTDNSQLIKDMVGDTVKTGVNVTVDRMMGGGKLGFGKMIPNIAVKGVSGVVARGTLTGAGETASKLINGEENPLASGLASGAGWMLFDGLFSGLGAWGGTLSESYGGPFIKYATSYLDSYAKQLKDSLPFVEKISNSSLGKRVTDIYDTFKHSYDTKLKDNVIPAYEKGTGLDRDIDVDKTLLNARQETYSYRDDLYKEKNKKYSLVINKDTKMSEFPEVEKWMSNIKETYGYNIPPEVQETYSALEGLLSKNKGTFNYKNGISTKPNKVETNLLDLENLRQQIQIKSVGNKADRITNEADFAVGRDITNHLKVNDPEKYKLYLQAQEYNNQIIGELKKPFFSTLLSTEGRTQTQDIIQSLLSGKDNLKKGILDEIFATNPTAKENFQQMLVQEMKEQSMVRNPITGEKVYDPDLIRANTDRLKDLGLITPDTGSKLYGLSHAVGTDFDSFLKLNEINPELMKGVQVGEKPITTIMKELQQDKNILENIGQLKKNIGTNPSETVSEIASLKSDARNRVMSQLSSEDKTLLGYGIFDDILGQSYKLTDGSIDAAKLISSIDKLGGGGKNAKEFIDSVFSGSKEGELFKTKFSELIDVAKLVKEQGDKVSPSNSKALLHALIGTIEASHGWITGSVYHFGQIGMGVFKKLTSEGIPKNLEELYAKAISDPRSGVKSSWYKNLIKGVTQAGKSSVPVLYSGTKEILTGDEGSAKRKAATPPDWFSTEFQKRTGEQATPEHWSNFQSSINQ